MIVCTAANNFFYGILWKLNSVMGATAWALPLLNLQHIFFEKIWKNAVRFSTGSQHTINSLFLISPHISKINQIKCFWFAKTHVVLQNTQKFLTWTMFVAPQITLPPISVFFIAIFVVSVKKIFIFHMLSDSADHESVLSLKVAIGSK